MTNHISESGESQLVLRDISNTGKERPWNEKGLARQHLAICYDTINPDKAYRLRDCGKVLKFEIMENGQKRLHSAVFCRVRLCPMCAWRRSIKIFAHTKAIMDEMNKEKDYAYIFATFTIKNCTAENLKNDLDRMMKSWNRFIKMKKLGVIKGWYRGLEITHNIDYDSKDFDTFHPHFHCIFAVNKSYFNNKCYITHEEWRQLWKSAMQLDYEPLVNVQRVKGNTAAAVAEVAKYSVKDKDYIIPDDWDLTTSTVALFDQVLDHRRLVAYGGRMKYFHKKLNLDDEVDGDLVRTDGENESEKGTGQIIQYAWNVGYNQYRMI